VSRCCFRSTLPIRDICLSDSHEKRFFLPLFAPVSENERIGIFSRGVFSCTLGVYRNLWSACIERRRKIGWHSRAMRKSHGRSTCPNANSASSAWQRRGHAGTDNYKLIAKFNLENNFVRDVATCSVETRRAKFAENLATVPNVAPTFLHISIWDLGAILS